MADSRTYGWKPDIADHRDYKFTLKLSTAKLPDHVDRIGLGNPIEDQGALGSCTGNSSTSAMEIVTGIPALSRLMAYYNGRLIEGTTKQDAGAMIRDVVKGIQTYGVSTEALWPYNISAYARKPTAAAYRNGLVNKAKLVAYNRLTTLNDIKSALAQNLPVIFGFSVPAYFESPDVAKSGWVRFPSKTDQIIGGHAVMACGYDERQGVQPEPFIWVRNSWGLGWGLQGYFKMPYQWFTDASRMTDDFWALVPVKK